jgi:hypothetical protein
MSCGSAEGAKGRPVPLRTNHFDVCSANGAPDDLRVTLASPTRSELSLRDLPDDYAPEARDAFSMQAARVVIMEYAETRLAQMSEEWTVILASSSDDREAMGSWEQSIDSMRREADSLRDQGRWRGGYRTLMHALGIQHREVVLTAGLAWLLDPDGWHGLGSRVLSGLLGQLGLPPTVTYPVTVAVEETRSGGETRADLVVRMPGVTLVIEAKIYAYEQPGQCDRLADRWAAEEPTLVFLTLDGRQPHTASTSAALWRRLAWSQVAAVIADAARPSDCAPGVLELLATIEIFGK